MGGFGLLGPMADRLGLSDAQKDQIKGILQSHRAEMKAIGERARAAHQKLEAAVSADTVDDAAIRQASAEVAAVEADMAVAQAHIRSEAVQVLTAEQKAALTTALAERQQRGGRGQGRKR
jgi:Spy/CpxP family protein refolding chaperone